MFFNFKEWTKELIVRPSRNGGTEILDGVRALCFLWIFHLHLVSMLFIYAPLEEVIEFLKQNLGFSLIELILRGHLAMEIFFMFSSFLTTDVLLKEFQRKGSINISRVYISRLLRLIPFYYIVLLIFVIQPEPIPNQEQVWSNFFFVNNLVPFRQQFFAHTWSIAIEVQFAIVFPPFLLLLLRNDYFSPMVLLKSVILACILRGAIVTYLEAFHDLQMPVPVHSFDWEGSDPLPHSVHKYYQHLYLPLTSRMSAHILGALLAAISNPQRRAQQQQSDPLRMVLDSCSNLKVLLCIVAICMVMVPPLTSIEQNEDVYPQWVYFIFLVVGRAVFGCAVAWIMHWCILLNREEKNEKLTWLQNPPTLLTIINSFLKLNIWHPIAAVSYAAYLLHVPLLGGFLLAIPRYPLNMYTILALSAICLPAILLISAAFHVLVERPTLEFRSKILDNMKTKRN